MVTQDTIENYKEKVKLSYKVLSVSLNKQRIKVRFIGYFINSNGLNIGNQRIQFADEVSTESKCKIFSKKMSMKQALLTNNIQTCIFKLDDIMGNDISINNHLRIIADIEGVEVPFFIGKPHGKKGFNQRYYYVPYKTLMLKNHGVHIRRAAHGILVLVKRPKDMYENSIRYKLLENRVVSTILYFAGKVVRKISKKRVNLFYEKFSNKAEEGTFELFERMQKENIGNNYFIINALSKDYDRIKETPNVIKQYSLKYYWLIYRVNTYIATEASSHLNVMRSNNKWYRRANIDGTFFFLQHGVTYLKHHSRQSSFVKGRESAVDYIIVNSEKEKHAVKEMLHLEDKQIFNTGMAIFDKMKYGNITTKSQDIVTIMLTWKPYEEYLTDFTKSGYYSAVVSMYNMLKKYLDDENIVIVAHPKVESALKGTPLYERMWHKPIFELIESTKLLITDYSSVCYQCFYRGAGVVFYQYDLKKYEENCGKLVPAQDEYIGYRTFDMEQLEDVIQNVIIDKQVTLEKARTDKHIKRYHEIIEWYDGENIERILDVIKNSVAK